MFHLILPLIQGPLQFREALILEGIAFCHQLQVLIRSRNRPALNNQDRMIWIVLRSVSQDWRRPLISVSLEAQSPRS